MSVGAFFDKAIMIALGFYFFSLAKNKPEKFGNKAAFVKFCGIGVVVVGVLLALAEFFK